MTLGSGEGLPSQKKNENPRPLSPLSTLENLSLFRPLAGDPFAPPSASPPCRHGRRHSGTCLTARGAAALAARGLESSATPIHDLVRAALRRCGEPVFDRGPPSPPNPPLARRTRHCVSVVHVGVGGGEALNRRQAATAHPSPIAVRGPPTAGAEIGAPASPHPPFARCLNTKHAMKRDRRGARR